MTIHAIFGTHEAHTLKQLDDIASRADHVALMADGHLGYIAPIGSVAAYRNKASVVGVGFDIACGNAAIRTDLMAASFDRTRSRWIRDGTPITMMLGMLPTISQQAMVNTAWLD